MLLTKSWKYVFNLPRGLEWYVWFLFHVTHLAPHPTAPPSIDDDGDMALDIQLNRIESIGSRSQLLLLLQPVPG